MADVVPAGWYPDPLAPTWRRFHDGARWTAFTCPPGEPPPSPLDASLSWIPGLAVLADPAPLAPPAPTAPLVVPAPPVQATVPAPTAPAPVALAPPSDDTDAATSGDLAVGAIDPISIAFGPEARRPVPAPATEPRTRRRLVPVAIAAAVALTAGAVGAGAVLRSEGQRPHVVPELAYRDDRAGFTLRYPDEWRVLRRDPDGGIRFAIGARGAPSTQTNTVSVVVGADAAALPPLHTLADQLTERLREQLPGVRLDEASRTRLAGAPAFRFAFHDREATPSTRIEQYVGRTTTGRPLTVTVTIREPRTAPTAAELRDFVLSLDPS